MKYKLAIIGAGPSGMMAAITAASNGIKGEDICLIEHNDKVGRKILVTGNGKCNITNMKMTPDCYRSDAKEPYFCVIEKFMPEKLIDFFAKIGLFTKNKNEYIYPFNEQAATVADALRNEISRLRIGLRLNCSIKKIEKGFKLYSDDKAIIECDTLIIATGSKCFSKTGSDGSGYRLARDMGHNIVPVIPALVQIKCREKFFKEIAGVRINAGLTLTENSERLIDENGELQLTDYGISGIPVFQISRFIKRSLDNKHNPVVHINFAPDFSEKELSRRLNIIFTHNTKLDYISALSLLYNKKLASVLLMTAGLEKGTSCKNTRIEDLNRLCGIIRDFKVSPFDTNGFENAQVCAGGVNLSEIRLDTMESKLVPKLYFAGEICDVDGICGGYNLQWAFSSGRLAGLSATKKMLGE